VRLPILRQTTNVSIHLSSPHPLKLTPKVEFAASSFAVFVLKAYRSSGSTSRLHLPVSTAPRFLYKTTTTPKASSTSRRRCVRRSIITALIAHRKEALPARSKAKGHRGSRRDNKRGTQIDFPAPGDESIIDSKDKTGSETNKFHSSILGRGCSQMKGRLRIGSR
jgi:hypothetical protein